MASNPTSIFLIIAAFIPISLGKEFIVGDDSGWTMGFNYQAWAEGKAFSVGDKLVFKYEAGDHNVVRVNGTGFKDCIAPAGSEQLATGNDVITLNSPGRKWYICDIGQHCEQGGQKLVITVSSDSQALAPSPQEPAPNNSVNGVTVSAFSLAIVVLMSMAMAVMA